MMSTRRVITTVCVAFLAGALASVCWNKRWESQSEGTSRHPDPDAGSSIVAGFKEPAIEIAVAMDTDSGYHYLVQSLDFLARSTNEQSALLERSQGRTSPLGTFLRELLATRSSGNPVSAGGDAKSGREVNELLTLSRTDPGAAAREIGERLLDEGTRMETCKGLLFSPMQVELLDLLCDYPGLLEKTGSSRALLSQIGDRVDVTELEKLRQLADSLPGELHKSQVYRIWLSRSLRENPSNGIELIEWLPSEADRFRAMAMWVNQFPERVDAARSAAPQLFASEEYRGKTAALLAVIAARESPGGSSK